MTDEGFIADRKHVKSDWHNPEADKSYNNNEYK